MSALIKSHNKMILSNNTVKDTMKGCNCRDGVASCPMGGNCLDKSMVYKAEVSTSRGKKHYYGQTYRTFKERFYGHQHDLRHNHKAESTTLSQYVWKMREQGEQPLITWSKVTSAKPYMLGGRACQLCITEKTEIAKDTSGSMLNRRRELMNKCLHKEPYKLSNFHSNHLQQPQPVDEDVHHDQPPLVDQEGPAQMALQEVWPAQMVDQDDQPVQVGNREEVQLGLVVDQDVHLPPVDHEDIQLEQQDVRPDQVVDQDVLPMQHVDHEEVQLVQVVDQDVHLPLVDHEDVQLEQQFVQPEPPDQGLPRRSKRSARRRFENLCLENLSNFSMQM
jgi:hypothetical protein